MISALTIDQSQKQSESKSILFGIFKPKNSSDIEDVIAHMTAVAASLEKTHNINVAIMRCLDCSWAAAFAVGKEGLQGVEGKVLNLPEAEAFTKGLNCKVKIVNSGFFRLNTQQTSNGKQFAELSVGDVVSIRRIECSSKSQDMLSYACLAILRSYFKEMKGIHSYSFYDSLDGEWIIGLAIWDCIQSALATEKNAENNPALPFWRGVGAKQLKYHVCQVVYATDTCANENCNPGFTL